MNARTISAPVKLLTFFVLLAGVPLAALGWLGWRLLQQDRVLENQRERDRLENAATQMVHELERGLAAWDELLPAPAKGDLSALPRGAVLLVFDSRGVLQQRGMRLPFYPRVAAPLEAPGSIFTAAEAQEFRGEGLKNAAAVYRNLASSPDRRLRAAALMRLARSLRKQQQLKDALAVYGELAAMGDTAVAGSPAELLARRERVELFKTIGDREAERHETELLATALSEGKYLIDRATFDFYRLSAPGPPSSALKLADAVEALWPLWQQQPAGKAAWNGDRSAFAAVWRTVPSGTAAMVANVDALAARVLPLMRNLQVRVALVDASGHVSWGGVPAGGVRVTHASGETGLPWTIQVAASNPAAASEVWASRRLLLSAGFGLMLLVIAGAGYFMYRAVSRELSVARLQSDFVAAVSHEFRTPLTAMRHLTEMLEEGETPQDRLPLYYRALGKETRRLHGMVESLLDFGRMEAGRRTYRMEDANVAELTRQVVDEFRERSSIGAHRLELQAPPGPLHIRADRDALALALRNLLDNAVKYSPEDSTVSVSVESQDGLAGISVEDKGMGIPKGEQQEVFRKFTRGSSAKNLNIKGTGIGLTMADQIVKAHGGRLELASEPGRGSRFTILLPIQADQT